MKFGNNVLKANTHRIFEISILTSHFLRWRPWRHAELCCRLVNAHSVFPASTQQRAAHQLLISIVHWLHSYLFCS